MTVEIRFHVQLQDPVGYACRLIRKALKQGAHAPFVILVGRSSTLVDKLRIRMVGADAVLDKPLNPGELHAAVAELRARLRAPVA